MSHLLSLPVQTLEELLRLSIVIEIYIIVIQFTWTEGSVHIRLFIFRNAFIRVKRTVAIVFDVLEKVLWRLVEHPDANTNFECTSFFFDYMRTSSRRISQIHLLTYNLLFCEFHFFVCKFKHLSNS